MEYRSCLPRANYIIFPRKASFIRSKYQHGSLPQKSGATYFKKTHSCETHLVRIIDDSAKLLDNGGQIDTFVLDFEKTFVNF